MRPITRCLAAVFTLVLLSLSSAGVLASRIEGIQANMLVNGDFENSLFDPGACLFNWPNAGITANVPGITAYGALNAIDFTKVATSCGFGPPPQSGVAKVSIERTNLADEFSIAITGGVVAGTAYTLTFYASRDIIPPSSGAVEIGLSNNASAFGTLVYTSPSPGTSGWTAISTSFEAPVNASHLTVRVAPGAPALIHLDTFSLEPVGATPNAHRSWGATKIRYRD